MTDHVLSLSQELTSCLNDFSKMGHDLSAVTAAFQSVERISGLPGELNDLLEEISRRVEKTRLIASRRTKELREKLRNRSQSNLPSPEPSDDVPYDLILIDDDPIPRIGWSFQAKKKGYRFLAFPDPEPFFSIIDRIDRSTPIYVDLGLGDWNGSEIGLELTNRGFKNLFLTTGASDPPEHLPHFRGIIGKAFPYKEHKFTPLKPKEA